MSTEWNEKNLQNAEKAHQTLPIRGTEAGEQDRELWIISFTRRGQRLSLDLANAYPGTVLFFSKCSGGVIDERISPVEEPLSDWAGKVWSGHAGHVSAGTGHAWSGHSALLFIGACGIAVRAIAPHVESKQSDPPVLVMDERGEYVIPLLSAHLGGGADLAKQLAEICGGKPVYTTASEVEGAFAVDVFARKNGLHISDMRAAKQVAAAIHRGEQIPIFLDESCCEWEGSLPTELRPVQSPGEAKILVSPYKAKNAETDEEWVCQLIPRCLILGMGCRKGKDGNALTCFAEEMLEELGLTGAAVSTISSIDVKEREPGLLALAEHFSAAYDTYSSEELMAVQGEFSSSAFALSKVGCDNVCERAVCAAGAEKVLLHKTTKDGMTCAIGIRKGRIRF